MIWFFRCKRLRILFLPTCVGLRYDHQTISIRRFSWQYGINHFMNQRFSSSRLSLKKKRICLSLKPTHLNRVIQHPDDLPCYVTPSLKRFFGGTGILTRFPSPTPFGLGLGID